MKRSLVLGGVVVALAVIVGVLRCSGSESSSTTRAKASEPGSARQARAADRRVDPRRLPRASIAGTVTDAATKAPLADAHVCGDARAHGLSPQQTREPICTTTDAHGRYWLKNLVPARYVIGATARTYRPAAHDELVLAAAQVKTSVDLALAPGGVEVTGTVADLTGGPIAAAMVRAHSGRAGRSPPVATDAEGRFSVWAAPGRVSVHASADGYSSGSEWGRAPGSYEIKLTPESSLAGTVVDATTNTPVAGVRVQLHSDDTHWDTGDVELADITADDGTFRIGGLTPGRYRAWATAPHGHGISDGSTRVGLGEHVAGMTIRIHPAFLVSGRVVFPDKTACKDARVVLSDGDHFAIARSRDDGSTDLVAEGVVSSTYKVRVDCADGVEQEYADVTVSDRDVTGLVWDVTPGAMLRGRLLTADASPVADAHIEARLDAPMSRINTTGGTASDDGGRFTIGGLAAGAHKVHAWTDAGNAPRDGWQVAISDGGIVERDFVLEEAAELVGSVVDASGTPVPHVEVTARGAGASNKSSRTGADGTFAFGALYAGDYDVTVAHGRSGALRTRGAAPDAPPGKRVRLEVGKTTTVKLVVEAASGVIRGSVLDASSQPIADAYITAARESDDDPRAAVSDTRWGPNVVTASDGTFVLDKLASGHYTVRARIRGGGEALAEHVPTGGTARLQVRATATLTGTVKSTVDITELQVTVRNPTTQFRREEHFYRSQAFAIRDIPPGTLEVTVSAPTWVEHVNVTLGEGETRTLEIDVGPRVTVTGRVVDEKTQQPVAGMRVSASRMRGDNERVTGADGRFTIDHAPTGTVRFSGRPGDDATSEHEGFWIQREVRGTGTVDIGDLVALRQRVKRGEPRGVAGITFAESPAETPLDQRVFQVARIEPTGPAARSGLEVGDVIIAVDGMSISGANALNAWTLLSGRPGDERVLGLARGATITVVLAAP